MIGIVLDSAGRSHRPVSTFLVTHGALPHASTFGVLDLYGTLWHNRALVWQGNAIPTSVVQAAQLQSGCMSMLMPSFCAKLC